jgi:hypothetical protein
MLLFAAYLLVAVTLCAAWYWLCVRHNRRRAKQVVLWLQGVLAGNGQVVGIRWIAPSCFKVPLRLTCGVFHRASVQVEMAPLQMPLQWLLGKVRGRKELVTFQADLDLPPAFSLHLHHFRWFARSSRKTPVDHAGWTFEHAGPYVISTRRDWKKELSSAMATFSRSDHEFSSIDFQRRSPHFSVTLPLQAISPDSPTRACVFDSMRELASSASASRF